MGRRPEVALFAIVFVSSLYFYQAGGWNQNARFDLVRAGVERGSARLDAYAHNTGDLACKGPEGRCIVARPGIDHYYCDKAPGTSWLALPFYAPLWAVSGDAPPGETFLAAASHVATVGAVGLPAALAVVALWAVLGALGLAPVPRAVLCLAYSLGSLAFPYATLLYGHQLAASLLLIGFALLLRRPGSPPGPGAGLVAGLCLGWAVISEYPAALAALAIAAFAAWRHGRRQPRLLLAFVLGGALPGLALALYNHQVFGGPLTLAYEFSNQPNRGAGLLMGIGAPGADALWGVTLSPYRGLFFSAPWLLAALPGWWLLGRRAPDVAATSAAIAGLFLWLNVSLVDWSGGWAPGPRYQVPALPFWTLGVAGCVLAWPPAWRGARRRAALALVGITLGWSLLAMLAATAVKPEVSDRVERPYAFLLERFARGELAINTQSIDAASPQPGGPARAYNLGQLAGLSGLASLAPLLALWLGGGLWLRWTLGDAGRRVASEP